MDRSKGINHHLWKGGKYNSKGIVYVYSPDHHKCDSRGYVRENILVAEKALGEPLPEKAVVHHIDGNTLNNANNNLVICQNQRYHMILHARKRALEGCGDANKRFCAVCNLWKIINILKIK